MVGNRHDFFDDALLARTIVGELSVLARSQAAVRRSASAR